MTGDREPFSKPETGEDTELPGLLLVITLLVVLTALVVVCS